MTPADGRAAGVMPARSRWLTAIDVEAIAAGLMVGMAFVAALSWS